MNAILDVVKSPIQERVDELMAVIGCKNSSESDVICATEALFEIDPYSFLLTRYKKEGNIHQKIVATLLLNIKKKRF